MPPAHWQSAATRPAPAASQRHALAGPKQGRKPPRESSPVAEKNGPPDRQRARGPRLQRNSDWPVRSRNAAPASRSERVAADAAVDEASVAEIPPRDVPSLEPAETSTVRKHADLCPARLRCPRPTAGAALPCRHPVGAREEIPGESSSVHIF